MKIFFSKIIALLSALLFAITGVSGSTIGTTEGTPIQATKREYKFDNDKLLIGGYYSREDELQYCNDAGIEFIIASGVNEKYLDTAYSYGVGIIASSYNLPYCYENMTDGATGSYVNANPAAYKDHPALWGDNMIDEPHAGSFKNIADSANAYYSKFPGKLPFINLFPMYANEDQLDEHMTLNPLDILLTPTSDQFTDQVNRYKAHVSDYINTIDTDYICVDIYPYHSTMKNGKEVKYTDECWLRNLDVLAEACRETGRDLWVIPQAAGLTKDGSEENVRWCDEVSDISQQDYACLAFGTKAIIYGLYGRDGWWDMDSHMIGSDGKPTDTYYAVSEVDGWLADFAEVYGDYQYTSTYLLNRSKATGYRHGNLLCAVDSERGNIKSNDGLLIGTFTGDNGAKAYVVTNIEELNKDSGAKFSFDVPEGKTATVYYRGNVMNKPSDFTMEIGAGDGVYITVK